MCGGGRLQSPSLTGEPSSSVAFPARYAVSAAAMRVVQGSALAMVEVMVKGVKVQREAVCDDNPIPRRRPGY